MIVHSELVKKNSSRQIKTNKLDHFIPNLKQSSLLVLICLDEFFFDDFAHYECTLGKFKLTT